ncbi:prolyl oligopeptidase-like protein [Amylocarpus encephaloides]|uniref:Prolyl oligopeptidase-like protein n=1 Tax=Amylocarpus encephaloides TaxID=45428 RepID=A0A9P7YF42_9HELO|nr:prolyl oligopeptidase-like protein [Amylocarpus encephaloides]
MAQKRESSSYKLHMQDNRSLSLWEKLGVPVALGKALVNLVYAFLFGWLKPKEKRSTKYYRHVAFTAMRTLLVNTTARQQHFLAEPTDDAYLKSAKKNGFEPQTLYLKDGTAAHWIGDPKASRLIVNFHGGGYVFPAAPEMFTYMYTLLTHLNSSSSQKASCLFLSYDLAPSSPYPRQLTQAAHLLSHILTTLRISPSNILLTGDSAGANLVTALLSHITHPHPSPSIPRINLHGEKLLGALLISPWIQFTFTHASIKKNEYKDCVSPPAASMWSTAFLASPHPHTSNSDYYNQPSTAPPSFFTGWPVSNLLIVGGEEEVLIDSITEFAEKLKEGLKGGTEVEFFVAKGEYHDQMNLDPQIGYAEGCQQGEMIWSWTAERFAV